MPFWRRPERQTSLPLPLPPLEMRMLVGPTDPSAFDNPSGAPIFQGLAPEQYRSVLDFGCGCGRIARQLLQQSPRPERYEGLDLHAGMVRWCAEQLAPRASGFHFQHHDVNYPAFNPGEGKPWTAPLPFEDDTFSLAIAWSVFTHLTETQAVAYLAEFSRVLAPGGVLLSTWFTFDKTDFPMMQEQQNTLFINEVDIRNAVIFDRDWTRGAFADAGLTIYEIKAPDTRGFHWVLRAAGDGDGRDAAAWPPDAAPPGRAAPPTMPDEAHRIGAQ